MLLFSYEGGVRDTDAPLTSVTLRVKVWVPSNPASSGARVVVEVHFVLTANLAAYRQAEACYV